MLFNRGDEKVLATRWRASAPGLRLVDAIDGAQDQRTFGGNRVSTGTPGNRPKGMSRPLEAAPSGSLTGARSTVVSGHIRATDLPLHMHG
jgi:hypothetical protein